eukprot:CAMPEP_0181087770 /NCGR_PEP_ID=MMETSP1071-20121207/6444_1 /TAXON_ID=35127 /ORGANISM="Thalassiosira sp., Strain NH16" /LENGTH=39 /DNA_ID= /DNA_START= /DNA_END= /DNA_ORIENTATION=
MGKYYYAAEDDDDEGGDGVEYEYYEDNGVEHDENDGGYY